MHSSSSTIIMTSNNNNNNDKTLSLLEQQQQPTEDDDEYMYFVYPQSIQNEQLRTFHYEDHFAACDSAVERSQIETHYTQALCLCLGKGGSYTAATSGWLKGFLEHKHLPEVLVDAVDALLEQASELTDDEFAEDCDLLRDTLSRAKRSVVFDLLQGAAVTGFRSTVMIANVLRMATSLGVSDFDVEDIRYAVVLDEQYRRHQVSKLFPSLQTRRDAHRLVDHMLMMPRIENYASHGFGTGRSAHTNSYAT